MGVPERGRRRCSTPGGLQEAETYVRELLEMAEGLDGAMANAMRYQSRLERDRGHLAEAVEIARDAVRRADRSGIFLYRSRCLATYWELLYGVGDLPGAANVAEQAVIVLGGDRPGPVPREWAEQRLQLLRAPARPGSLAGRPPPGGGRARCRERPRARASVGPARPAVGECPSGHRLPEGLLPGRWPSPVGHRPGLSDLRRAGRGRVASVRGRPGGCPGGDPHPVLELEPPIRNASMAVRALALATAIEADSAREAGPEVPEEAAGSLSA